jgi:hypothetical protein
MKIKICIFCCLVAICACKPEPKWDARFVESDKYNFFKFIEGIKKFPYRADESKFSRVVGNFRSLKLGMPKEKTSEILGAPDSEEFEFIYPDEKNIAGSSNIYLLTRMEKELANKQDKAVCLYFDKYEKLYWAQPINLDLKDIGGPRVEGRIRVRP